MTERSAWFHLARALRAAAISFLLVGAAGSALAPVPTARGRTAEPEPIPFPAGQSLPLKRVTFSGHRYVVAADVGHPVPLMIHGNSGMFLSLTHEIGERVSGGPVSKREDYGYTSRGKGLIHVAALTLGSGRYSNLRDVPVFDFTEERGGPVQGMLGVAFLTTARAAVDFSRDALIVGVAVTAEPDPGLLRAGYACVAMRLGPDNKVTIPVYFPSLARTVPLTPSTVSTALSLHRPLFAGKIAMKRDSIPNDQSPRGTRPELFVSNEIEFEVAGRKLRSPASLEDWAEYAKVPEKELRSFGMLGFDWMDEHRAVLDYANLRLYFMP